MKLFIKTIVLLYISTGNFSCRSDESASESQSSDEYINNTGETGTKYPAEINITGIPLNANDNKELKDFVRDQFFHMVNISGLAGFFKNANSDGRNTMRINSVQIHVSSMLDISGGIGADVVFEEKDVEANKDVAKVNGSSSEEGIDPYSVEGTGLKIGADINVLRMTIRPVGVYIGNDGKTTLPVRFNPRTFYMGVQIDKGGAGAGLSFDAKEVFRLLQIAVVAKTGNLKVAKLLQYIKPFFKGDAKVGANINVNHGLSLPISGLFWLDDFNDKDKENATKKGFFATNFTEHIFNSVGVRMCEYFRSKGLDVNKDIKDSNNPKSPDCQANFLELAKEYANTGKPGVNPSEPHLFSLHGCIKNSDGYFINMTVPEEYHAKVHKNIVDVYFTAVNEVNGRVINISPTSQVKWHSKSEPAMFEEDLTSDSCPKKQEIAILSKSRDIKADPDPRKYVCMSYPVHTVNKVGFGGAIRCNNGKLEFTDKWLVDRFARNVADNNDSHWKEVRASLFPLGTLGKTASVKQNFDNLELQSSSAISLKDLEYESVIDPDGNPSKIFPEDLSQVKIEKEI